MSAPIPIVTAPEPPWIFGFKGTSSELVTYLAGASGSPNGKTIDLDGAQLATTDLLFNAMQAAFHLPGYFGHNWDALDECLSDLSWFPATQYQVAISNWERVLEAEPRSKLIFERMMLRVAEEWATPIQEGQSWDRPSIPFHWIICVAPGESTVAMNGTIRLNSGIEVPVLDARSD